MTCVYALREAIVEFYRAQGSDSDLEKFQDELLVGGAHGCLSFVVVGD